MAGSPTAPTGRPQRAKRVARACDYCRKKRLKCTPNQRPCLNCQLYDAECTTRDRGRRAVAARSARKDDEAIPDADSDCDPVSHREGVAQAVIHVGDAAAGPPEASGLDHALDSNISQALSPTIIAGCDFDNADPAPHWNQDGGFEDRNSPNEFSNILRQLGIGIPSSFCEPDNATFRDICSIDSGFMETSGQSGGLASHPLAVHGCSNESFSCPPYLSPSASLEDSINGKVSDIESLTRRDTCLASLQRSIPPGVLIRKNKVTTNFIGANSVGATIALCLKDALESQRLPLKPSSLGFLIEAGSYVDEVRLMSSFDLLSQELPPQDAAKRSIEAYFHNLNAFYPIVDEVSFLTRSEMFYSAERSRLNLLDYCLFYLVVSLGASSQRHCSGEADGLDGVANGSYQRAWSMMQDCTASPSEASLQVLLLHTIHLVSCGKPGIAWVYCGLAIRFAQALGLHRNSTQDMDLPEHQLRLRARLWWIIYSFDANLSLSQGRPPGITDSSCDKRVSAADTARSSDSPLSPSLDQIYAWMYNLSQIQNRFCNLASSKETATERMKAIIALDEDLLSWRDNLPTTCRPDHLILVSPEKYHHVLLLHLEYSNLLRAIHWAAIILTPMYTPCEDKINPRIQASEAICLEATRSFIKGLNDSMGGAKRSKVFVISFQTINYMAAIAVLYRSILRNWSHFSARADLEYLRAGKAHLERDIPENMIGPSLRALFDNMLSSAQDLVWNTNINRNSNDNDKDNNDDNNPHREA